MIYPKKNILITGGCGYVGSVLVPALLNQGHKITVVDLMIYGEDLIQKHDDLTIIKGDIRDFPLMSRLLKGINVVIHLACISNDPSFELNPTLGKSINLDPFEPFVQMSKKAGVERFVYASSSSVYGIKSEPDVTEDMSLEPLTDYSLFKAKCEEILQRHQTDDFTTTIIRPATVCGYSPRQRLDVVVNILSNLAFHKRKIAIFGGEQLRPNIHINDMVAAYLCILNAPKKLIQGQIFNAGCENHSVNELGELVRDEIGKDVVVEKITTDDNRSYHVSSQKIKNLLGFETSHSVRGAIRDLKNAFERKILCDPLNNEIYFNIKRMQTLNLR